MAVGIAFFVSLAGPGGAVDLSAPDESGGHLAAFPTVEDGCFLTVLRDGADSYLVVEDSASDPNSICFGTLDEPQANTTLVPGEADPTPTPTATPAQEPAPAPAPQATPTPAPQPAPEPTPTPAPAPKLVSFASVADAHVKEAQPDNSSKDISIMTVRSEIGKGYRSFVRFDASTIPAGASVNSATLTLCAAMVGPQRTYDVHRVAQSWDETSATWNNQPATAAAATASATTPLTPGCMTWDVTADVQAWVNGASDFGWRINDRSEGEQTQSSTDFRTREDTSAPGQQPKLEVTYTAS